MSGLRKKIKKENAKMINKVSQEILRCRKLSKVEFYQVEEIIGNGPYEVKVTLFNNRFECMMEFVIPLPQACEIPEK